MSELNIAILSTLAGGIVLGAVRKTLTQRTTAFIKMKSIKKRLKKAIHSLNFSEFKDIIYEITILDSKYETSYLVKIKKKYFISEDVLTNKKIFMLKYDRNYDFKDFLVDEIERERSVSRLGLTYIN